MIGWSRQRVGLPRAADRRGVALPAALFALAIIGALVASSFLAGLLEQQSGQSSLYAVQAREAAEAGIAQVMAAVPAETLEELTAGGAPLDLGITVIAQGLIARRQIERLTSRLFLIRAEGSRQDPGGVTLATRSLGLLVQTVAPGTVAQPASSPPSTRVVERGWVRLD